MLDLSRTSSVSFLCRMKDIKIGTEISLGCKVCYVHELSTDEWLVFVCDGIDTPLLSFTLEALNLEGLLQNICKICFLGEMDANAKLNIQEYEKRIVSEVRRPLTYSPENSSIIKFDFKD